MTVDPSFSMEYLAKQDIKPEILGNGPNLLRVPSRPWLTVAILIASDLLALVLSGLLSVAIRVLVSWGISVDLYANLWPMLVLFVITYAATGLYPGVAMSPASTLRRITLATSLVYLATGVVIFLFQLSDLYSRAIFLVDWILSLAIVPLARAWVGYSFARRPWWGRPVILMGAGPAARTVVKILQSQPMFGLKPVAILDDNHPSSFGDLEGVPVVGKLDLAPALATTFNIQYAILAMPEIPCQDLLLIIERYGQRFHHLLLIPDLAGFSSLWVEAKDMGGLLGLEVKQQLLSTRSQLIKRLVDILGSATGLLLTLPLLVVIALWIKLDSRGDILFSQERLGKDGNNFKAYKFRSMYLNAEQRLQEILASDPVARLQYETYHKLPNDPRVTRVGRWLRRYSLDELPQLLNVLNGEMSLVGPRAYLPRELPSMNRAERIILKVKPALTGLWQVSGRNTLSFQQRLDLDVYYVRNWSLWLDIYILARTVWVVVSGHGSH